MPTKPNKPGPGRPKRGAAMRAKMERYREEVIAHPTRTLKESAVAAGYKAGKSAQRFCERMSADHEFQADLARRRAEVIAKVEASTEVSVAKTLRELHALVHSRIVRDPVTGKPLPIEQWSDEAMAAVSSIKMDEAGVIREVKLWDKPSSLDKAMKHLGLFREDNKQRSESLALKVVFGDE